MTGLRVSGHAISRYRERVEDVPYEVAHQRLSSPAIVQAAQIGCAHVKLPGGQRVVIQDHCVVTVTPRPKVHRRAANSHRREDDEWLS